MLMIFQSLASMVLAQFEDLIKAHVVIALFLTMLIGSGGNAGGQSVCVCVCVCMCVCVCVCNLSLYAHRFRRQGGRPVGIAIVGIAIFLSLSLPPSHPLSVLSPSPPSLPSSISLSHSYFLFLPPSAPSNFFYFPFILCLSTSVYIFTGVQGR